MDGISGRSVYALKIARMALMLVLAGACSRGPGWTADEKENSKHFFLSLQASEKATQLIHKGDPDVPQFGIEKINEYQRTALSEAGLVQDSVLDKAHPQLREHFRSEYQMGLDLSLKSYAVGSASKSGPPSGGQIDFQSTGVKLLKQWTDWMTAHNLEIKMPQDPSAGSR